MPAAVFITQAVIGKCREHLGFGVRRFGFAKCKLSPRQLVRFGEIKPILPILVFVKLAAIRVLEIGHVWDDLGKFPFFRVPAVEDIDDTFFVVGQVSHIRDKDASVRCLCKKPHAL